MWLHWCSKALMLPPGLGFISISLKHGSSKNSKMPKFITFLMLKSDLKMANSIYTAVSLIFVLKEFQRLLRMRSHNIFQRHLKLSQKLYVRPKSFGLKPLWKMSSLHQLLQLLISLNAKLM